MVRSEDFISYVLSVNVRTLKIIINLINNKNAYKRTKTKKAVFLFASKTSKWKKVTYLLNCAFVLFVLFVINMRVKSFRKKKKRFKTTLITSFILLLH